MSDLELLLHVAALAAAAFAVWSARSAIPLRAVTSEDYHLVHLIGFGYLVAAHLLTLWAVGPWVAAGVFTVGMIGATEPWTLLRRRDGNSPHHEPSPREPARAGAGEDTGDVADPPAASAAAGDEASMTAEERAAWDSLVRRLDS